MPNGEIAALSLAVIAAGVIAAVIVLIATLIRVRRTAMQVERILQVVDAALPQILMELETLLVKVNRTADAVANLSPSIERWGRLSTTAARTLEELLETVNRMARAVVVPLFANIAGVLSAVGESVDWIRPRHDKRRAMSERGNFAVALVLGGVVGVALGVLLTPAPGHETREKLRRGGEQLRDRAREQMRRTADDAADRLRTNADDVATRVRSTAGDVIDRGRATIEERSGRLSDVFESGRDAVLGGENDPQRADDSGR